MSSARETILADIRRHLRNTDPMPRPQVLTSRPPDMGAPVARFTAALEAVGGHVHRTGSPEQAKGCVLDLLEKYLGNGGGVFTSATPTLRAWLSSTGHCVVGPDGPREDQLEAGVGLTEAQLAIAETGTLVLRSDNEEHRLASLLPRVHIAVLNVRDLVPELGEALAKLQTDGIPPVITFITGPSRTGDIELTLVVGVHGPEILHVVLVDEKTQGS